MAKQDDKDKISKEDIRNQAEYNRLLAEQNRLRQEGNTGTASATYTAQSVRDASDYLDLSRQITEDIKDQLGMSRARSEADRTTLSLVRQLQSTAAQVTAELGAEAAVVKQLQRDRQLQRNLEVEIGTITNSATEQQIASAQELAAIRSRAIEISAEENKLLAEKEELELKSKGRSKEAKAAREELRELNKQINDLQVEEEKNRQRINDIISEFPDADRLGILYQSLDATNQLIKNREKELRVQQEITQAMGVTGAVVTGLGGIMQRLGLRSGIFNQTVEDTAAAMREVATEAKRSNKEINRMETMMVGIKTLIHGRDGIGGLKRALGDPATIALAVLDAFLKVDAAATKVQQTTGQNVSTLAAQNSALATSVQFMETLNQLTAETGMNAQNIFPDKTIAKAAEFQNTLGLSAHQAARLGTLTAANKMTMDGQAEAIVDQVSSFNKANRSAISQGVILRDVAEASDDIKASLGSNPASIAKAAAAARRLGMELGRLDQIASSLMDFESSIEAELEAQLLTGKNINLAKARELALNNDLAGLGKELFKNSADIAEFGKMNRIQQEAQAKALGMTREELAKIAYQRALENGLTDEAAAKAAGVRLEDMKRVEAQEALKLAIDKVLQALAPILDIVGSIANALAPVISFFGRIVGFVVGLPGGIGKIAIAAFVAAKAFGGLGNAIRAAGVGIGGILKSIQSGWKTVSSFGSTLLKTFTNPSQAISDMRAGLKDFANVIRGTVTGKVKSAAGDLYDVASTQGKMILTKGGTKDNPLESLKEKAKEKLTGEESTGSMADNLQDKMQNATAAPEPKTTGEKIKEFLQGLAEGLKAMSQKGVLKGALNLIPAGIGLVAMIPGAIGAKLLERINGGKFQQAMTGLATGIMTFGNMVSRKALVTLGLAGLAFAGFSVGSIGLAALAIAGIPAAAGLTALAPALIGFAQAMSTPTPFGPVGLVAPAALALLGASMIPFAYALSIAAPAFTAFGTAVKLAFEGIAGIITAVMDPLVAMFGMLTLEKALAVAAMGPALISLGLGLSAFSMAALFALPGLGVLGALALMGPGLTAAGNGIKMMADNMTQLASALSSLELEKIDELKELVSATALAAPAAAAAGAISSMISGLSGGNDNESMNAKLDELIQAVREGKIIQVAIDGESFDKSQVLRRSKVGK